MTILDPLTALEREQLRYIVERVPEWPEGHDVIWTSSVGYICALEPDAGMHLFKETSWDFEPWPIYSPRFTRAQYDAMKAEIEAQEVPSIDYRAHCEALAGALEALVTVAETNPFCPVGHFVEHGGADVRAVLTRWKEDSK